MGPQPRGPALPSSTSASITLRSLQGAFLEVEGLALAELHGRWAAALLMPAGEEKASAGPPPRIWPPKGSSVCVRTRPVMSDSDPLDWRPPGPAPLSLRFSRQEYWSGLPFPPPGESSRKSSYISLSLPSGSYSKIFNKKKSSNASLS